MRIKEYCKKFIAGIKQFPPVKIYLKFLEIKDGYDPYRKLIEVYGENETFLIAPSGTGDIYIISHFYQQFIDANRQKDPSPCLVISGRTAEMLIKMYGISGQSHTQVIEPKETAALMRMWPFLGERLLHGKVLHWGIANNHMSILRSMEGTHGFNMYSMFQHAIFNGAQDKKPKSVVPDDHALLDSTFKKYALKQGKTVLLVPYSNSLHVLPNRQFWVHLTEGLLQRGYSVCTNVAGPEEKAIPGTQALMIPIEQAIPFLNWAGNMISVRTGFADITEASVCKRLVLYPRIDNKRSQVCTYFEMFSINAMYGRMRDIEIEYEPQRVNNIIQKILSNFGDKNENYCDRKR